ncbi:FHA domain-containing protein [Nocardia sp. NBC_01388]|uniref:FHA domain-containing protein n=1 Tax=Nocardia sp. NBC_01388 TaxID=2903596 RepID=UPI0032475CB7
MDRQVEVVAGNHVLMRVAGSVLLVAHRERERLTAGSRAVAAANALADLVTEATRQSPGGPGGLVARQATRWLMKEAERISPGQPVEFGILTAAQNGGLAIFLHGSVTAVLAGRAVEYYRGGDAAFTVDRIAEQPGRAAALFVEDGKRRVPELPERGIGSLVAGVAQAVGAVVWFEGEPAVPQLPDPPPTAAYESDSQPIPLDPNLTPTRTSTSVPAGLYLPPVPSDERELESPPATAGYDPLGRAADDCDPHRAPTEMGGVRRADPSGGPAETGGTNPAPKPDPDLQRRLEATAKATALTVKVLGFKCARAHPSDPRSAFCSVCGMPVDQTQPVAEVIRPPLGMLVLDDGMTYMLAADAVVGRDPEQSEAARAGLAPLKIDDNSGGMSRAHAEIRLVNWDVTLVDRGSTNGTRARLPGYRDWVRLQANQPMTLVPGTEMMLGNRVLRLEPVAPPPFG